MGKFKLFAILVVSLFSFNLVYTSTGGDTITSNQPMKDGETLVSEGGVFELGFFNLSNSSSRYLGIWYKSVSIRQVVWVANREAPIASSTGVLKLSPDGNLTISDHTSSGIWSTGTANASDPVVQLLDTGNLVLSSDSKRLLWQSFDYPSHALLPGMKLGRNFRTNLEWKLTSWKSDSDPSPGAYTYMIDTHGPPEGYVLPNGSNPVWRSGPWDGHGWDGVQSMTSNGYFHFRFISNQDEMYYDFELTNNTILSLVVLQQNGVLERLIWLGHELYWKLTPEVCDTYNVCGNNGVCQNDGSPVANCKCLTGFRPRFLEEWEQRDWSGGCLGTKSLGCGIGDGFVKLTQLKLPDTSNTSSDSTKSLDECRDWCLQNCYCLAYAVTSKVGGGCIIWFGNLTDIRDFKDGGEDLYLRLAASERGDEDFHRKKRSGVMIIIVSVISGALLIGISLCMVYKKCKIGRRRPKQTQTSLGATTLSATGVFNRYEIENDIVKDSELPLFAFRIIAASTNNFSNENKIGEGGFGPVYKGILPNGQEIAVKRLSKGSLQGVEEFKNEIRLIVNLQHKNLVRLLGCCVEGEERILVYEYLPNGSLDRFLFDSIRAVSFDWQRRRGVIHGVAQGLLYLHKYSRLRIIHRDLKTSNILLDSDMNPKISDFGIARIFGGNQDQANTNRVVGTYGYMPPEYAIEGLFSEKSDVFSFGVLLLETVTGKKNSAFHQLGDSPFFIRHIWELWKDGQVSELMDPVLRSSCPLRELSRCVHVGLLCVQKDAAERPTMSTVISFLDSDIIALPSPKTVAFCSRRITNAECYLRAEDSNSTNQLTITAVDPR